MLELSRGLSAETLDALADLERRVLAVDGGRLKLEWDELRTRRGEQVEDFLWWDAGRLLGFAGLYRFGGEVEATGMVDPQARGRGIADALLDAVLAAAPRVLLVVPRTSGAGRRLALRRGGTLHHSEHAMEAQGSPPSGRADPSIHLRPATDADRPAVNALLTDAFGGPGPERPEHTWVAERDGVTVGTLRVKPKLERVEVYGFAVAAALRGRGIGRQILHLVRQRAERTVALEVAVENDRALGLYTALGFVPVSTEDYYSLRG